MENEKFDEVSDLKEQLYMVKMGYLHNQRGLIDSYFSKQENASKIRSDFEIYVEDFKSKEGSEKLDELYKSYIKDFNKIQLQIIPIEIYQEIYFLNDMFEGFIEKNNLIKVSDLFVELNDVYHVLEMKVTSAVDQNFLERNNLIIEKIPLYESVLYKLIQNIMPDNTKSLFIPFHSTTSYPSKQEIFNPQVDHPDLLLRQVFARRLNPRIKESNSQKVNSDFLIIPKTAERNLGQKSIENAEYVMHKLYNRETKNIIIALSNNFLESKESINFRETITKNKLVKKIFLFPQETIDEEHQGFSLLHISSEANSNVELVDFNRFENINEIDAFIKKINSKISLTKITNTTTKVNKIDSSVFENYLMNFEKLQYYRFKNIEQNQLIKLSELIGICTKDMVVEKPNIDNIICSNSQLSTYSIFINTKILEKSKSSICYLLKKGYLYLNPFSFKLEPKIYNENDENKHIGETYIPFKLKNDSSLNTAYLIEILKEIDYRTFIKKEKPKWTSDFIGREGNHIYIIKPSMVDQLNYVNNNYLNIINDIDEKKYFDDFTIKNNNNFALIRYLQHAINPPIGASKLFLNRYFTEVLENIKSNPEDIKSSEYELRLNNLTEQVEIIDECLERYYDDSIHKVKLKIVTLNSIINKYKESIYQPDIFDIEYDYDPKNNYEINGDITQIMNVLQNLQVNAIQHAFIDKKTRYKILIKIKIKDNDLIISFCNSGSPFKKGFDKKEYVSIGKTTKNNEGGFGGDFVYTIMKLHKGDIEIVKLSDNYSEKEYVTQIDLLFKLNFKNNLI
jgi:hypothetical protein